MLLIYEGPFEDGIMQLTLSIECVRTLLNSTQKLIPFHQRSPIWMARCDWTEGVNWKAPRRKRRVLIFPQMGPKDNASDLFNYRVQPNLVQSGENGARLSAVFS
ncbi:hypothetical protein CDAR_396231 [Caerostris darwini]|uniref:Uncharacterized protein n=1 Tax=Caerostris darwini TaxID=1538125 RepID=A0AAV4WQ80_9ARAC|nr:hypothetical protein CDAR_396231 [Caerostris darwini]